MIGPLTRKQMRHLWKHVFYKDYKELLNFRDGIAGKTPLHTLYITQLMSLLKIRYGVTRRPLTNEEILWCAAATDQMLAYYRPKVIGFFRRWTLRTDYSVEYRRKILVALKKVQEQAKNPGDMPTNSGICFEVSRHIPAPFRPGWYEFAIRLIGYWRYKGRSPSNTFPMNTFDSVNYGKWEGTSLRARRDLLDFMVNALESTLP